MLTREGNILRDLYDLENNSKALNTWPAAVKRTLYQLGLHEAWDTDSIPSDPNQKPTDRYLKWKATTDKMIKSYYFNDLETKLGDFDSLTKYQDYRWPLKGRPIYLRQMNRAGTIILAR